MDNKTEEKILLISRGAVFMNDMIMRNLRELGYRTLFSEPAVSSLELYKDETNLVLINLGRYLNDDLRPFFDHLSACVQSGVFKVGMIGKENEYAVADTMFDAGLCSFRLLQPASVYDLKKAVEGCIHPDEVFQDILLVDDDEFFLKTVHGWLSDDYHVTMTGSGEECLLYLETHHPDLVLLDYSMPGLSGAEVLKRIRSIPEYRDLPVIFLTGKNDRDSVMNVLELKPQGYILKTAGRDAILERVKSVIR